MSILEVPRTCVGISILPFLKMSLNLARKSAIDTTILAKSEPKVGRNGQSTLRLRQNPGKSSYTILSRADGSLTPSGRHYYTATGRPEPSAQFDR